MHRTNPLLLDTHIWIWLMDGAAEKIPAPVRAKIAAASERGLVYVSPISVWEVAMLESRKRVVFSIEARAWVERALAAPGLQLAPFSPEIIIDSTRLPGDLHNDPADRFLIATARNLNGVLVTRDFRILEYSESGHVRTLNAEA